MPDLTLFKDSTPGRLITGIVAGLTFWVRREIVLVELGGSAYVPVIFSGCWLGLWRGGGRRSIAEQNW